MSLFNLKNIYLNTENLKEDMNFLINYQTYKETFFSKIFNLNHRAEYDIGTYVYVSTKKEGFWCKIIFKFTKFKYKVKIIDDIFVDDRFLKGERMCINSAYFISSVTKKNKCSIM